MLCAIAHAQPLPPAPDPSTQVRFTPPKVADLRELSRSELQAPKNREELR